MKRPDENSNLEQFFSLKEVSDNSNFIQNVLTNEI